MTALREAMIRAMQMRGFSQRTHHSYLMAVTDLARRTKRSPADLSPGEVNGYFEHLVIERGLAPASCRLFFHGIRFLYVQVLHWPEADTAAQTRIDDMPDRPCPTCRKGRLRVVGEIAPRTRPCGHRSV